MAWYIRRVCPQVRLYVAKLDPQQIGQPQQDQSKVSFTIDSAASAIEWARKEEVDIISMSWAIKARDTDSTTKRHRKLADAVHRAAEDGILLFCAHPDAGAKSTNDTYPKRLPENRLFCIGAAGKNRQRWEEIDPADTSCDFFFPGVDLGIEAEGRPDDTKKQPPHEWKTYSGSSLSCALAAGLAAAILHCARVCNVTIEEFVWLKSYDGMKAALESIPSIENGSLVVNQVFGQDALLRACNDPGRKTALRQVIDKLLVKMPDNLRNPPQPET